MIGHPSETLEDVQAIADLCKAVRAEGKKIMGHRAQVNAGVSTFVPKAAHAVSVVACCRCGNDQRETSVAQESITRRWFEVELE